MTLAHCLFWKPAKKHRPAAKCQGSDSQGRMKEYPGPGYNSGQAWATSEQTSHSVLDKAIGVVADAYQDLEREPKGSESNQIQCVSELLRQW
jgi:hypothetical protein